MKVALLTIWRQMNYGAELQAYATVKMLKNLGCDVKMINILLSDQIKPNFNGRVGRLISSIGPIHKKFESFWENIPVTQRYHTLTELQRNPPKADVYMVGSDQVWNPDITREFAKLYFLDFGDEKVRRVSYASSFGTPSWNAEDLTKEVGDLLHQFSYISCREKSGTDILSNTFGLASSLVLDPTLLFPSYVELTGTITHKNTLLYYPLYHDPSLLDYSVGLAKRLNLRLVNNKWSKNILGAFAWDSLSIEEWVKNIAESQFVVTRSFHGLAFSILYKKQFAIIASKNNRGTRILNLLSLLGLSDRYYDSFESCEEAKPWANPIDYDLVMEKLENLRRESIYYLKEALR